MATQYTYDDDYITSQVEAAEIEAAETKALNDLEKQGVVEGFYLGNMCMCLVYIDLAGKQLESEGMSDRVSYYRTEYKRYSQMNLHENQDQGVISGTIGRM